jgi:uncharacterized protein DUF1566
MKRIAHHIVLTLGLIILAADAADALPPDSWDTRFNGTGRFRVLGQFNKEAVLDRETGLVWQQAPNGAKRQWDDARDLCMNRSTGGRRGWRLPSFAELASLALPDAPSTGPALPEGHPFSNVQADVYWSATTDAVSPTNALFVTFVNGGGVSSVAKASFQFTWCVRGPMHESVY